MRRSKPAGYKPLPDAYYPAKVLELFRSKRGIGPNGEVTTGRVSPLPRKPGRRHDGQLGLD
jgi:hypothetical protein